MKATRRNLGVLAIMTAGWIGVMSYVAVNQSQARGAVPAVPGQQGQPPAAAPAPGGRGGAAAMPGTEDGIAQFETRCSSCHNNPTLDLVPSAAAVRELPPERILESITTGTMKSYVDGLNDGKKRRIAEFMSGRPMGSSATASGPSAGRAGSYSVAMTVASVGP